MPGYARPIEVFPHETSQRQGEDYLARGFRNVDAAAVGKMARCLAYMDGLPAFQQYKTTILEMMKPQPDSLVADLGCGLGFDVRRLSKLVGPEGRAIGVDASLTLIESARAASEGFPAVEFIQADIQKLPFASGSSPLLQVDRTLQHVERPQAVLSEIFRTMRPGGRVVCADPDWGRSPSRRPRWATPSTPSPGKSLNSGAKISATLASGVM